MKKLFLLLFLLLVSNLSFSQVEISSRLQDALNTANPNDYIKVIVLLRSQVDFVSLDQQLVSKKVNIQQRAFQVITALKENAENTQSSLKIIFQLNHLLQMCLLSNHSGYQTCLW